MLTIVTTLTNISEHSLQISLHELIHLIPTILCRTILCTFEETDLYP